MRGRLCPICRPTLDPGAGRNLTPGAGRFAQTLAALAIGLAGAEALAQSPPERPLRILVGYAPGGPADALARIDAIGGEPGRMTPPEFARFIRAENARWRKLLSDGRLSVER